MSTTTEQPPVKHDLGNGFHIEEVSRQIGVDLWSKYFYLHKGELYVAQVAKPLLEDEPLLEFNVLGECEERAYCIPHEILREADSRAYDAFKEYIGERQYTNHKSGWCTKTQYWKRVRYMATEAELKIVTE